MKKWEEKKEEKVLTRSLIVYLLLVDVKQPRCLTAGGRDGRGQVEVGGLSGKQEGKGGTSGKHCPTFDLG